MEYYMEELDISKILTRGDLASALDHRYRSFLQGEGKWLIGFSNLFEYNKGKETVIDSPISLEIRNHVFYMLPQEVRGDVMDILSRIREIG